MRLGEFPQPGISIIIISVLPGQESETFRSELSREFFIQAHRLLQRILDNAA